MSTDARRARAERSWLSAREPQNRTPQKLVRSGSSAAARRRSPVAAGQLSPSSRASPTSPRGGDMMRPSRDSRFSRAEAEHFQTRHVRAVHARAP